MKAPEKILSDARTALAEGGHALASRDWAAAVARARAGLDELGHDYAALTVIDDTELKLGAAEDLLREGQPERAAKLMLRMLDARIGLFVRKMAHE